MAPGIEAAASPHGRAAAAAAVAAYYQQGSGYPEAAAAVAGKIDVQWRAIQTALLPVYDVKCGHFERAKMTLKMLPNS